MCMYQLVRTAEYIYMLLVGTWDLWLVAVRLPCRLILNRYIWYELSF